MKIKEIKFTFKEVKIHTLILSKETGCDMPNSPKDLVDCVNGVRDMPSKYREYFIEEDSEIESTFYEIIED